MYPWKPGATVDAAAAYTVPVVTLGVTTAAVGAVFPKNVSEQVPDWAAAVLFVPPFRRSVDVLEIARPVSKPSWFVTNGNRSVVLQAENAGPFTVAVLEPLTKFGTLAEEPIGAKLTVAVIAPDGADTAAPLADKNTGTMYVSTVPAEFVVYS